MKKLLRPALVGITFVGLCAWGAAAGLDVWKQHNKPRFRQAAVTRGRIISVVNATGKVQPVRTITVGSFVSGPIDTSVPLAQFNQEVAQGELLCKIEARIHKANLDRDQATLASRVAELDRAKAQLRNSELDLERITKLSEKDKTFIAETEKDKFHFTVLKHRAEVALAEAGVQVADSSLAYSRTQLEYCEIRAPEAGIVINRKIEPGQTLAAQFTAPELFVIAPNMRERIDVLAAVDEADIGAIRRARDRTLPVTFTVDAYSEELFEGRVEELRMNSTTTQNVVTYPVIVAAANADLKLLPGMTASLSFEVDERDDCVRIPNAALRFFPTPEQVRKEDKHLVSGTSDVVTPEEKRDKASLRGLSAADRSALRKQRSRRHVWVVDGELLRAVEVLTGLSDSRDTELVEGDIREGDELVTGVLPPAPFGSGF